MMQNAEENKVPLFVVAVVTIEVGDLSSLNFIDPLEPEAKATAATALDKDLSLHVPGHRASLHVALTERVAETPSHERAERD
jgi:hypothetical protein